MQMNKDNTRISIFIDNFFFTFDGKLGMLYNKDNNKSVALSEIECLVSIKNNKSLRQVIINNLEFLV